MFYCELCKISRDWPISLFRSKGKCEICGKHSICYSVPSKRLPVFENPIESKYDKIIENE